MKDADPADDTVFNFGLVGGEPATETRFTLQDPTGPSKTFTGVVPGIWGLGEDGWPAGC